MPPHRSPPLAPHKGYETDPSPPCRPGQRISRMTNQSSIHERCQRDVSRDQQEETGDTRTGGNEQWNTLDVRLRHSGLQKKRHTRPVCPPSLIRTLRYNNLDSM